MTDFKLNNIRIIKKTYNSELKKKFFLNFYNELTNEIVLSPIHIEEIKMHGNKMTHFK